LQHVEGLAGAELAVAMRTPQPVMERLLENARRELRQKLVAAGCHFREGDGRADHV
jgi:hypothetical protein